MTDRDVDAAVEQLRETAICMRGDRKRGDPNDAYSALADEMDLACDALAEARQEIAAQAQEFHKLTGQNELRKKQMARFPFCSDHRDKVLGRPCRECEREKAERRLVAQAQEIDRLNCHIVERRELLFKAANARIAAQRERDAQQLDHAAAELDGTSRANSNIARILHEEATKMRATRTPQELTGAEDWSSQ